MIVLCDMSNLTHRAFHTVGKRLTNGTVYGTLRMLLALMQRLNDRMSGLVLVWDGYRYKERVQAPSSYKANRVRSSHEHAQYMRQRSLIKLYCERLRFLSLVTHREEADFLIASGVRYFASRAPVLIVSSDKDFFQLLSKRVALYRENALFTQSHLWERERLTPEQWLWFRCLTGDPSDNLRGVGGIGAKHGRALASRATTCDEVYRSLTAPQQRMFQRNFKVMNLREEPPSVFQGVLSYHLRSDFPSWESSALQQLFCEWGFRSFLKNLDQWCSVLNRMIALTNRLKEDVSCDTK